MRDKLREFETFLAENSNVEFNSEPLVNKINALSDSASMNDPDVKNIFGLFRNIILQHAKLHQSQFFAKMKEIFA